MADTIPVIWGQTSDGKDAYVKTCTAGVYNPATGKTISEEMVTMQDSPAVITGETPIKPVCDASGNVICPQTRTEAVYDPESGQTMDKVIHPAYSTTEQWTGEYYIGKDSVKRKVYSRIVYDNAPGTSPHKIDLGIKVVDIVDFRCQSKLDAGGGLYYTIPVPYYVSPDCLFISYIDEATKSSNSKLHYGAESAEPIIETRWTLKYTKQE